MADAPTQDKKQEAPAARAPETSSPVTSWLKDKFTRAAALVGNEDAKKAVEFKDTQKPGDFIIDSIAKDPAFQTPDGKKQIETLRGDKPFMDAMNLAISSDPAVRDGMLAQRGNIGGMEPKKLVEALQDSKAREVMTKVLIKVAEKPGDKFGLDYVNQVGAAGAKKDYTKLDALLTEGNIKDDDVKKGAMLQQSGLGALAEPGMFSKIGDFMKDPDKAIKGWMNDPNGPFAGLEDGPKNFIAGLVKMLAKVFKAFMPGGGFTDPYIKLFGRVSDELKTSGSKITGLTHIPETAGPKSAPHVKTSMSDDYGNPLEPSKKQKAQAELERKAADAAGTAGDKGNTKVADAIRPTQSFNQVSAPDQVAPANTVAANDPTYRQTGTGGPSLNS